MLVHSGLILFFGKYTPKNNVPEGATPPGTYQSPAETGFYYLQSRYYDPEIGRFINADAFNSTGQGIIGNNMFAYCNNNPVNRFDTDGHLSAEAIMLIGSTVIGGLTAAITEAATGGSFVDIVIAFVEGAAMEFAAQKWPILQVPIILYDVASVIYECYISGASFDQCLLAGTVTLICSMVSHEDRNTVTQLAYDLIFGSGLSLISGSVTNAISSVPAGNRSTAQIQTPSIPSSYSPSSSPVVPSNHQPSYTGKGWISIGHTHGNGFKIPTVDNIGRIM